MRLATLLSAMCVFLLTTAASAAELGKIQLNEYLGATFASRALHHTLEIPQGRIKDTARCTLRDTANQPVLTRISRSWRRWISWPSSPSTFRPRART